MAIRDFFRRLGDFFSDIWEGPLPESTPVSSGTYRDWSDADLEYFEERNWSQIYSNIDGIQGLDEEGQERAAELYEQGWLTFGVYSPDELQEIRDEFFDLVGLDESQFDWLEYRELYAEAGA
jgi:hypothetical protein